MEVKRNTNDIIEFPHEGLGKFYVELKNADIIDLKFMANGIEENGVLKGTNRAFLEAVHKSLGSLLKFLDEGHGSLPAPVGNAPKDT